MCLINKKMNDNNTFIYGKNTSNFSQLSQKIINFKELLCQNCLEKMDQKKCSNIQIKCESERPDERFKSLLIEKEKLDLFEKNIRNASEIKKQIKNYIDSVINELYEKIEYIESLAKTFFESLEIEIKFSELLYQNYQQELEKNNLHSFLVQNFENHINFYVPELNISKKDSLKEKINKINSYLNQNINNKFQKVEIKEEKQNNNIDANYQIKTSITFKAKGFFDYNESLFGLFNNNIIKILTKNKFEDKITIKESIIKDITACQKNKGNKIVVFTKNRIFFIEILDKYSEYIISGNNYFSEYESLVFNLNLDLFKISYNSYNSSKLEILLFPEYTKNKLSEPFGLGTNDKIISVDDNLFFLIKDQYIKLVLIKGDKCKELVSYEISINNYKNSVIDLNEDYIALNSRDKIFLFDKKNNYSLSKTIYLDIDSNTPTNIYKINNFCVSLFIKGEQMNIINYDISMKGIKWEQRKTKRVIDGKISYFNQLNKNNIIFIGEKKCYLVEMQLNQKDN